MKMQQAAVRQVRDLTSGWRTISHASPRGVQTYGRKDRRLASGNFGSIGQFRFDMRPSLSGLIVVLAFLSSPSIPPRRVP